jgi:type I restriction enzyme, S subunit
MELRPGYKQTEVGVIPEEWEAGHSHNLIQKMTSGLSRRLKSQDIGIPVLISGNIQNNRLVTDELKYWYHPDPQGANIDDYVLNDGDILLCFINSIAQIGKPCIFRDIGRPSIYTTNLFRIVTSRECVTEFAYFLFSSMAFQAEIQLIAKQAVNQASFTKPDFLRIWIPIPPLPEQRAIANALSDVDALINSLDKLIAKKRDIKQGAMQELLTGKRRLPGFSGEWVVKRLGEILKVRHGKSQYGITSPDGKYPILASGGEIGRTNACIYDKPSVLIGRKGTIDSPQYVDSPFWTVDTLFFTEIFSEADAKFVFYKFNMIHWRSYNEASGVPSLNAKTIENIEITSPLLPEQIAIATILCDMDAEIAALERKRDKTRLLKQGMMQELLTGRIRLV